MSDCITHVGLDAHKKDHKVAMYLPGSDVPLEAVVPNTLRDVERWVRQAQKKAPGEIVVAYEAGVCGFALQRQIERAGVRCIVIAPSLIPIKPGQRVQTDRRDAAALGRLLRSGMLTEVHPPNVQQEAARDLCRCREAAMRDLGRVRHQVLKFLLRRGMSFNEGVHWTHKHMAWLGSLALEDPMDRDVFAEYLGELEHRQERLARLDRSLERLAQSTDYKEKVGWLRCFQGIDTVTALSVLVELYAFARFASPRELMSYLGLTPSESSSGATVRKGGITKAGNSRVRRLLIESAWQAPRRATASKALQVRRRDQPAWVIEIAKRSQQRLYQRYWRLVQCGKMPVKAATAVAREMVGFLWSVLREPRPGAAEGSGAPRPRPPDA
jgi:transposase